MKTKILVILSLVLLFTFNSLYAATYTIYSDFATFQASLGGASLLTQNFEGYSNGTDLYGVDFIPGVNVTSNMQNIVAFPSGGDMNLFGYDRSASGDAYYDINSSGYNALSFYIDGWETDPPVISGAVGPGEMDVYFSDLTSIALSFDRAANDGSVPVFFGILADVPIDKIRWNEPLEVSGGNEETTLDNFAVTRTQVPEPSTLLLLGSGLVGAGLLRRRFRS
jgi:hypothetical protein